MAVTGGLGYLGHEAVSAQNSQQAPLPSPADLSRVFVNIAKQIKPTVVNINVVEKRQSSRRSFEGFPQIPGFPMPDLPQRRRQGTGSGVIISADGYILTNNHVAGDAAEINVRFADGKEMKAKLVGVDPETDLAVIKVDAEGLAYAKLGNSDNLEQGEWVIALGSPFGLQQTMTAGIVSATGRDLRMGTYDNYIQTDASINPGNSGGPLVNMDGEVVGINTLIFSQTGQNSGIGFAIPSKLANKVYGQLIKSGRVTRGYLGVNLNAVTPQLARAIGYSGREGAVVENLAGDNVPAAKAGLRSGDVIVEFDGKPIKSPKELTEIVADTPVGKTASLKYVRDGRAQNTTINLGERPVQGAAAVTPEDGEEGGSNSTKLGIRVIPVTPENAREYKLRRATGVIIESVQPGSPAGDAGLREGDVIHRIDRTVVTNPADLARGIAALGAEKEVVLQIERDGRLAFVSVTLE
jgi:serine protease Do